MSYLLGALWMLSVLLSVGALLTVGAVKNEVDELCQGIAKVRSIVEKL